MNDKPRNDKSSAEASSTGKSIAIDDAQLDTATGGAKATKTSTVRDANDRYANQETSYLLG